LNLKDSITISHALLHYIPISFHSHHVHSHTHTINDHIDLTESDKEAINQHKPLKKAKHKLVKNNKVYLFVLNNHFIDFKIDIIFCKKNDFNFKLSRFVSFIVAPNLLPPELA
jgi:hypothetical protein